MQDEQRRQISDRQCRFKNRAVSSKIQNYSTGRFLKYKIQDIVIC